ncbi:MAG: TetR/AcrR family transcriptional regulator [Holophagaceae bacterium]|nr:TetR/AcrR family transcriptional regulator [Holophagaceae bacterium]
MSQVRERILEVASNLFYKKGIQAVGVDAIIAQAEVARMSFYRHFKSKEGLVLAFLERRDEQIRSWFEAEVLRLAPDPSDRPLAVFDALALRFATQDYRGCAFINTMAEIPNREDLVHQASAKHKALFQDYLGRLLRAAGFSDEYAPDLLQLFDGAVVSAVRVGSAEPAFRAKRLAALLLGPPARTSVKRRTPVASR